MILAPRISTMCQTPGRALPTLQKGNWNSCYGDGISNKCVKVWQPKSLPVRNGLSQVSAFHPRLESLCHWGWVQTLEVNHLFKHASLWASCLVWSIHMTNAVHTQVRPCLTFWLSMTYKQELWVWHRTEASAVMCRQWHHQGSVRYVTDDDLRWFYNNSF